MKEIMIKIIGIQEYDDAEKSEVEVISEGQLYTKNDAIYLIYEDMGDDTFRDKTRIKARDKTVKVTKTLTNGESTTLLFDQGKRYDGKYKTSMGQLPMEIFTNSVENTLKKDGSGKIVIDYDVSLKGIGSGKSQLTIEIIENKIIENKKEQ